MAQPFMAGYAARFDKAELDKIADRFKWVDENMFDEAKGIYFHAASETYLLIWLRKMAVVWIALLYLVRELLTAMVSVLAAFLV